MTKCIVCGMKMAKVVVIQQNVLELIQNRMKPSLQDQIQHNHDEIDVCELCWYGMMYSGMEYVWNGQDLLVFNESEGEYIEPTKNVWKPTNPVAIQFEWCENSRSWMTMPRGGKK